MDLRARERVIDRRCDARTSELDLDLRANGSDSTSETCCELQPRVEAVSMPTM